MKGARQVGSQGSVSLVAPKDTNMVAWFADKNKDFAYAYHRTVLQMLHDVDPPQTHWQLKSPLHTLWIDSLLKYYPQVSIIMSHRHLDEVIPSACRIFLNYNSIYFNANDSQSMKTTFEQAMSLLDIWIQRIIEFRTQQPPPKNIFDIQYKDLVRDPIGTVRRIYDYFDFLHWSDEFEKAMHTWLVNNPQGKQGRHSYSLDEFGLAKSDTKDIYKQYENLFLRE
ncbi:unnamed protein product [Rotaria sp. Silwood1]|nr:unnamed protein product [Rotaria sp. Silwood1]CAF5055008.1 unnamed protein product [Rotaria sp. Silwood1]